MFSATMPEEVCFPFPRVWDVVFIHELLRVSEFYDLYREFHTCTPQLPASKDIKDSTGALRQEGLF